MLIVGSSFRLRATVTRDGLPLDLAGATVRIKYIGPDGRKGDWPATVVSAPEGTVYTDISAAGNDVSGMYKAWAEADFGAGAVVRTAAKTFFVFREGEGDFE